MFETSEAPRSLETDGKKSFLNAVINYRRWVMVIFYGLCFGVELTMNNIIAYLYDQFDLPLRTACRTVAGSGPRGSLRRLKSSRGRGGA